MYLKIKNIIKSKFKINKFFYNDLNLSGKGFKFDNSIINIFFLLKFFINKFLEKIFNYIYFLQTKELNVNFLQEEDKKNSKCFIIGCGPSINEIDFKKFKGLDTFVTSTFYRHHDFLNFEPTFYCILDPVSYIPTNNGDLETKENKINQKFLLEIRKFFKPINMNIRNTKIIFPYQLANKSVEKYELIEKKENIKYVYTRSNFISDLLPSKLSLNRGIPNSMNVLPWMICLALAMNYKEIYLVGAEQDMYLNGSHASKSSKERLTYSDLDQYDSKVKSFNNKKSGNQLTIECNNYISMWSTLNILKSHQNLKEYAIKNNQKIFNTTYFGILDTYEMKRLDDII